MHIKPIDIAAYVTCGLEAYAYFSHDLIKFAAGTVSFVLIGAVLNMSVVHVNGGMMPVRARSRLDCLIVERSPRHCLIDENTKMRVCSDVIDLNRICLGHVSIGDVLILAALIFGAIHFALI